MPKYYLEEKPNCLYRCIKVRVDCVNNYIIGKEKTFWPLTSTSPDINTAYGFLEKEKINDYLTLKKGTILTLSGKVWGYDISLFNVCGEKEILSEPERKYEISKIYPEINKIINIECTIKDTPTVLSDFISINVNYEGNTYKILVLKSSPMKEILYYALKNIKIDFDEIINLFSKKKEKT